MIKKFFKKHNKKIIAFIGILATTICGVLGITKTYAYTYDETTDTITSDNLYNDNASDYTKPLDYYVCPITLEQGETYTLSATLKENVLTQVVVGIVPYGDRYSQFSDYLISIIMANGSIKNPQTFVINNNWTSPKLCIYATDSTQIEQIFNNYEIMLNKGSNAIPYEPYGKTFIDKSLYDSLENGFEYLQQEYLNLLEEHEELVNNYTNLQSQYNTLQSNYNTLNTNYTNLQAQFDNLARNNQRLTNELNTLQNEYDQLLEDYNELINTDTNGLWAYFGGFSIGYVDNNNTWQTLEAYQTFEDFKNSQYNYLDGISINLSNLKTRYPNYDKFTFACQGSGTPLLLNALSYKINNDGNTTQNGIVLESFANTIQIDYTNLIQMQFKVNYQNIYDNLGFYDENKRVSILLFTIEYDNSNNFEITSLNNEYNYGYITGYQNGRDSLNSTINSLNDNIDRLNEQVANQQNIINDLNYQINAINNQYGLNNLMWTIGGLPFESFKHIWNVNFFGINIADFILGFVTTFIGIYILKKFFF